MFVVGAHLWRDPLCSTRSCPFPLVEAEKIRVRGGKVLLVLQERQMRLCRGRKTRILGMRRG